MKATTATGLSILILETQKPIRCCAMTAMHSTKKGDEMFNHKDARIIKLLSKGMSASQVARKIGMPGEEGEARVIKTQERHQLKESK